jgi:aryl-alcohol dehydrogenase-like predicted oxidoreductase
MVENKPKMEYRLLGKTGLKISAISYGNWLNSNTPEVKERTVKMVKKSWDLGINFFDTAEVLINLSPNFK